MIKILMGMVASLFMTVQLFAGDVTAIKAGYIIHPDTGKVVAGKVILIENGRIKAIVNKLPKDGVDSVIDLSGQWVMPGMMDMHTHITYRSPQPLPRGRTDYAYQPLQNTQGYRAILGLKNAQDMLKAGFTTIRDVGNNASYADTDLRKALAMRLFDGPRIVNSGKIISVYGAQSHGINPEVGRPWQYEYIDADSPAEIIKAIRKNVFYGAQLIKVVVGDQQYELSKEDLELIVAEAAKMNMVVAAHSYGDDQVRKATLAGAATIEHGEDLSPDVLKLMAKRGTILVGTDFPSQHMEAWFGFTAGPAQAAASNAKQDKKIQDAKKYGVMMAFGTDVMMDMPGRTRAEMVQDYFDVYQRAGLTPMDLIQMLTVNGAKAIRKSNSLGAIKPGYIADIVAFSADPSADMMALKEVSFVMRAGRVIVE